MSNTVRPSLKDDDNEFTKCEHSLKLCDNAINDEMDII